MFVFLDGHGEAVLEGATSVFAANDLLFVRAGTRHNIVNTGSSPLRLITIYAPPQHPVGTVHLTRAGGRRRGALTAVGRALRRGCG